MAKWKPESESPPEYFIRYHLDDIEQCIWGSKYNSKFFKFVGISRRDFKLWCEMYNIPLPEFWFPPGWSIEPEFHIDYLGNKIPQEDGSQFETDEGQASDAKFRANQSARIACRQIAERLWKEQPDLNITEMTKHHLIQKYGGGEYYELDTVRGWIGDLAPGHIKGKRGRPPKDNK